MRASIAVLITLTLVYRARSQRSLTPAGIVVAVLTATAHAVHPWNLPFGLLIIFFLAGTRVTKIKHDIKATLTEPASGKSDDGPEPRTHIQVLANSGVASVLSVCHTWLLRREHAPASKCLGWPADLLVVGIIANYAAVAADTFSSELGILSKSPPRLITSCRLRKVPPGTNGGVTLVGLAAGLLGSFIVVMAAMLLTPFCSSSTVVRERSGSELWDSNSKQAFAVAMTLWGALGSVVDSFLGGWLQHSIVDTVSGKIVEGSGGSSVFLPKTESKVREANDSVDRQIMIVDSNSPEYRDETRQRKMTHTIRHLNSNQIPKICEEQKPTRIVESGFLGWLDNNGVNFTMALIMSVGGMLIARYHRGDFFGSFADR